MIIAVDCDGTLADNKQVNTRLIGRLIKEQRKGNQVILWTCRTVTGWQKRSERYHNMV